MTGVMLRLLWGQFWSALGGCASFPISHWGSLGGSANIDGVGDLPVGPNRLNKSRASASMRPSVPGAPRS